LRKFRVQFLDHNGKMGEENCSSCVVELSRFFQSVSFESTERDESTQINERMIRDSCVSNNIQSAQGSIDLNQIAQVIPNLN